jgi:hypothetical protein
MSPPAWIAHKHSFPSRGCFAKGLRMRVNIRATDTRWKGLVPEGSDESSPAIYCWVSVHKSEARPGRDDRSFHFATNPGCD